MENNDFEPKKKAKFFENHELIARIKARYITGRETLMGICRELRLPPAAVYTAARDGMWREEMEQAGIPIPKEPKPVFVPIAKEVFDNIESDYMRGESLSTLAAKYNVSLGVIKTRASKYKWNYYRNQINESRNRKNVGITLANKMAEFDNVSCKFIEAATEQIKQMAIEIETSKKLVDPERLDKLIKIHLSLHESVKKLQARKQTPAIDKNTHPALMPAPILKTG